MNPGWDIVEGDGSCSASLDLQSENYNVKLGITGTHK